MTVWPIKFVQKKNHISQSTITEKTETSVVFLKSKLTFLKIYRDINTGWYVNKSSIKPFWPYGI